MKVEIFSNMMHSLEKKKKGYLYVMHLCLKWLIMNKKKKKI